MSLPVHLRKRNFSAQVDNLAEISAFVQPFCKEICLDSSSCYHVEIAVDEACSNIIEHAYSGSGEGEIEICCQVNPGDLTITLTDHGKPFTPGDFPEPDVHAPLEERDSHGLGLFFIRNMMDKVVYTRGADHSNILTLVKFKK